MKACLFQFASMGAVLLTMSISIGAVEVMEWDRTPLMIDLPVGKERLIVLDRNVSVGLPATVARDEVLRVQSTGGVLYLKAHSSFDTQRVQLRDEATGDIILVDLTASENASDEQIKVVSPSRMIAAPEPAMTEPAPADKPPLPVLLTRYAAQSLYAPVRVIETVPGLNRVAMRLPASLPALLPALPIEARPIAAWSMEGWHVTAIRLRNLDTARSFELDPRYLQGALTAATFVHPTLGPRGQEDDTTTVIVVTRGALVEQLLHPRIQPSTRGLAIRDGGA